MSPAAKYRPGQRTGLLGEDCVLVIADAGGGLIQRCWPLVQSGAEVGTIVEALTRDGLGAAGEFALVRRVDADSSAIVVVRGSATVEAVAGLPSETDSSVRRIDGRSVSTWVETELAADRIRAGFDLRADDGVVELARPFVGGIVRVEWIELAWDLPQPLLEAYVSGQPRLEVEVAEGRTSAEPMIDATRCPYDHLTDPAVSRCRVCGTAVAGHRSRLDQRDERAVPGRAPVRLRPNEPMLMAANNEVTLGDEVVFRFEVTP